MHGLEFVIVGDTTGQDLFSDLKAAPDRVSLKTELQGFHARPQCWFPLLCEREAFPGSPGPLTLFQCPFSPLRGRGGFPYENGRNKKETVPSDSRLSNLEDLGVMVRFSSPPLEARSAAPSLPATRR